ncbi:MAG: hypothetical protein RLZ02_1299, partial [Actinomycetota bacterium]
MPKGTRSESESLSDLTVRFTVFFSGREFSSYLTPLDPIALRELLSLLQLGLPMGMQCLQSMLDPEGSSSFLELLFQKQQEH